MIYIGNHLSSSKGFEAMGKAALKLGANTFAFFYKKSTGRKGERNRSGRCGTVTFPDGGTSFLENWSHMHHIR